MTTFILGAGPAGLAIADGITESNLDEFIIIEKNKNIGGLAQTIYWKDIGYHDLGPHKIYSQDINLVNRVEKLIDKEEWLTQVKKSSIYIKNYYLPYPPSPISLGKVFGIPVFLKMSFGYLLAIIKVTFSKKTISKTFEDDLINRVGSPLYNMLFKPTAMKLWGDPKKLDAKLSIGRVQTPSMFEIVFRALGIKKTSSFEALNFRYPKGGLSKLWNSIKEKTSSNGKYFLEHNLTGITIKNNRITELKTSNFNTDVIHQIKSNDYVVTSLPLGVTVPLLADYFDEDIEKTLSQVVELNDLILVFLHIDTPKLLEESWIFIPGPEVIFHRVSEQKSFDYNMVNEGTIVCCEIMSSKLNNLKEKSDDELYESTIQGLKNMGYIDINVLDKKIINLPKSYPVFNVGYEKGLKKILNKLDSIENFKTIGRQGAFNYIGTLDAMDIGYGFVNWLKDKNKKDWKQERDRTSLYPVLD